MILITQKNKDYELLDSGDGEKLERFGSVVLHRPDPQVLWKKHLTETEWKKADARFEKKWLDKKNIPVEWNIGFGNLTFVLKLSSFKHVGVFPEQSENWKWIEDTIKKSGKNIKVLNLFGYTGGATLAALSAGAEVVHVDGSKIAISLAKENVKVSGLETKPVRWILDDAMTFLRREVRRGNTYDAIVMDPPAYGHGPDGEVWKIEKNFQELLNLSKQVLSPGPLFFLINGYASGYSSIAYENSLKEILQSNGGIFESGELVIEESGSKRFLPAGIFSRWRR